MEDKPTGSHGVPGKAGSYWLASTPDTSYPALNGDIRTDVAVLGGGITGITTALLLKKGGLRVALVEAGRIVRSVTGFTTAHISSAQGNYYRKLIDSFGTEKARMCAHSAEASIEKIVSLASEYRIDCDLSRPAEYVYSASEDEVEDLKSEFEAVRQLDLPVTYVSRAPLPFENYGAIRYDHQAKFHPRKYLLPLAEAVNGDGSSIFENTRATDIEDGETCKVKTDRGTITAANIVVATQVPFTLKDLLVGRMKPYRSYVLGVRAEGDLSEDMFYSTEEPCHYIRTTPAEGGPLLIVGGEDHKTGAVTNTAENYRRLEKYTRERYKVKSVDFSWSTQDYYSFDSLPFIGRMPDMKHCYVGTGYKGTGMTYGTVAAMVISDQILKGSSPWQEVYDPHRVKLSKEAVPLLETQAQIAKHYVGERLKAPAPPADIPAGGAGLAEIKGERANVYRDESGTLHAVRPQCTHMGCYTEWNEAEKTWDCPCHGSRFDLDGSVIHGPAVRPLRKID